MDRATPESDFIRTLNGRLQGILRWPQWDRIRQHLCATGPWYYYDLDAPPPRQPLQGPALCATLDYLDRLLRREHDEDYCGLAYADDLEQPSLVKIYHPQRMGKVCGSSGVPIPPGWVISVVPPEDLSQPPAPTVSGWRRWLGRP